MCSMRIQSHHDPADALLTEPCTISPDSNGLALDKLTQRERGGVWANSNSREEFLSFGISPMKQTTTTGVGGACLLSTIQDFFLH